MDFFNTAFVDLRDGGHVDSRFLFEVNILFDVNCPKKCHLL